MASILLLAETKVDNSFLVDYTISSIECPSDHTDGKCTIHFALTHADVTLQVDLKGGGVFVRDNGTPLMTVHFANGILDGGVTKFDEYSNVVLKGYIAHGKESGLFVEYDEDGNEVWSGYYLHGKRHLELKKSKGMTGFHEERDHSGTVVCLNHFDPTRLYKDGLLYEVMNGKVSRACEYKEGSFHLVGDDIIFEE